jgi:phage-related minor tail protein
MGSMMANYATRAFTVVAIITTVVKALKDIDSAGRESAEMSLRLGAALKATGEVVGFTQHQLEGMADAMSKATRFDDDGIKRAQSVMLTFSNVTGGVFTRGMSLAADYAKVLGVDLSSAARVLGRALNDPVDGVGRLSLVIGKLDPETRDLIKTFQENGDTMQAQITLIEALEKKFGGFAATIGGSSVVAVDKLRNAWGDLMKELAKTSVRREHGGRCPAHRDHERVGCIV